MNNSNFSKIHTLKIDEKWFNSAVNQEKQFEVRVNDRGISRNDTLILEEHNKSGQTGNYILAKVKFVLTSDNFSEGIKAGWCIIGFGVEKIRYDRSFTYDYAEAPMVVSQ